MTPNEKALIEDLFNRLRSAAPSGRDAEAESAIAAEMTRSPGAAYALVQTVLVQDQALREAHDRVQAAETAAREAAQQTQQPQQPQQPQSFLERAGSALQGFGGQRNRPPFQQGQEPEQPQARQGGGFLSGALQTAAGVAGGALLFEGVRSMFGGGGGGLLGGGSGAGTTVNETIINEGSDKGRDDNVRDASDNRDDDDKDDNVQDASYDSDDDDGFDDGPDGSDDDSWV